MGSWSSQGPSRKVGTLVLCREPNCLKGYFLLFALRCTTFFLLWLAGETAAKLMYFSLDVKMVQFLKDAEVLSRSCRRPLLAYFMGSNCQDAHLAPWLTFCWQSCSIDHPYHLAPRCLYPRSVKCSQDHLLCSQ